MTLEGLLARVDQYRAVLVSGCQRSGTHIMAKIIAHELGWDYITDQDYDLSNFNGWSNLVLRAQMAAIQCPHMSHILHEVPTDVAVVWMRRNPVELLESFIRVNPQCLPCSQPYQMLFYSQMPGVPRGQITGMEWIDIREQYWEWKQAPLLGERGITFEFDDLAEHELFVPKPQRKGWAMNQTEAR